MDFITELPSQCQWCGHGMTWRAASGDPTSRWADSNNKTVTKFWVSSFWNSSSQRIHCNKGVKKFFSPLITANHRSLS